MTSTPFPSAPLGGVSTYNACPTVALKSGAEGNLSFLAICFEEAKAKAEEAFCRLKTDLKDQRLLLRYVRALRRCERMKSRLLDYVAPSPSLSPQPEPGLPDA